MKKISNMWVSRLSGADTISLKLKLKKLYTDEKSIIPDTYSGIFISSVNYGQETEIYKGLQAINTDVIMPAWLPCF